MPPTGVSSHMGQSAQKRDFSLDFPRGFDFPELSLQLCQATTLSVRCSMKTCQYSNGTFLAERSKNPNGTGKASVSGTNRATRGY